MYVELGPKDPFMFHLRPEFRFEPWGCTDGIDATPSIPGGATSWTGFVGSGRYPYCFKKHHACSTQVCTQCTDREKRWAGLIK
jgi:hypothetical protein